MTSKERNKQTGDGQAMIAAAEWKFAHKEMSREDFDARCNEGNALILNALDGIFGSGHSSATAHLQRQS